GVQLLGGNGTVYMLGNDDELICEIVELFGLAPLEPGDRGQGVAHGDRVDVDEERPGGRTNFGIGEDLEAVAHVARSHRLAVMPTRARVERKSNRQRICRPG